MPKLVLDPALVQELQHLDLVLESALWQGRGYLHQDRDQDLEKTLGVQRTQVQDLGYQDLDLDLDLDQDQDNIDKIIYSYCTIKNSCQNNKWF